MFGRKTMVICGALAVILAASYGAVRSWSSTAHGMLDWRVGVLLKYAELTKVDLFQEGRPVADIREFSRRGTGILKAAPTPLPVVRDIDFPGPAGRIPARVYVPGDQASYPVIIYYHGGGWVIGDLDSHDNVCRDLAVKVPAVVLSVDYRLAPEHVFPAAVDDAFAAMLWVTENAVSIQGDPTRIAVAGDSAGGNLAAVVARMARDRGVRLSAQVLIYPAVNLTDFSTDSYRLFGDGYYLTRRYMEKFRAYYMPDNKKWADARVSPLLHGGFSALPPAMVLTAQFDVLRDEGEAYAAALEKAGVPVTAKRYPGMIHGFIAMDRLLPAAKDARRDCAEFLRSVWAR
ncbi:MAG: alpha/beta hydrolase [Spirochaetes bacterium]|nr:alpha/beta hydrolase [Spirochaetota bacterium]